MRHNITIPESIKDSINNSLRPKYGKDIFSIELEDNKKKKFYGCSWDMTQKQEEEVTSLIGNNPKSKIDKIKKEEDKRKFTGFNKKQKEVVV